MKKIKKGKGQKGFTLIVIEGTVDWNGTTGTGSKFEDVSIGTADPDGPGPTPEYDVYLFNTTLPDGKRVDYLRINEPKYGPYTWDESGLVARATTP